MFCIQCGKENLETAHYCAKCGASMAESLQNPTVPPKAKKSAGVLESIGNQIANFASTEKLEGFSLREFFSEVLKKRESSEIDEYFVVGTPRTTPSIEDVSANWPKPWFFFRVLTFLGLIYLGSYLAFQQFANPKLIPGLIMMGSLAAPLATVILFFELNVPRNISFNRVLILVASGGIVSLFVASIGFSVSDLDWLGASQAGIIEEIGKLLAVIIVARSFKGKYILNGLLYGAAVGAGFAFFESAGYAFEFLEKSGRMDVMFSVIQIRAFLTPFGHVAWTAIAAGALWRVKGEQPFQLQMLMNAGFLKTMVIPILLHMAWDAPFSSPFNIHLIALGIVGWFVVFGLVQQGLRQIREEQLQISRSKAIKTALATVGPHLMPPSIAAEGKLAEA